MTYKQVGGGLGEAAQAANREAEARYWKARMAEQDKRKQEENEYWEQYWEERRKLDYDNMKSNLKFGLL